jgi:hypothetical protein
VTNVEETEGAEVAKTQLYELVVHMALLKEAEVVAWAIDRTVLEEVVEWVLLLN